MAFYVWVEVAPIVFVGLGFVLVGFFFVVVFGFFFCFLFFLGAGVEPDVLVNTKLNISLHSIVVHCINSID